MNHREFDNHLLEDMITLTDQIPTGIDPYVAIRFDKEDIISPMDIDQSTVPVNEHLGETDVEMAHETRPNNELGDFNVSLYTRTYVPRPSNNLKEALNPSTEGSNATWKCSRD
ncbi:Sister chromatid cohesion 1 protein 3 [Cardamine amara subsp. amara]|uniref:Sister chromatid cohesion 1 protein 3 n=1 Tax=Cardamine amara subsp. amara TaxID=228776 RepID=A0ABD0Z0U5_CARAN